MTTNVFFSVVFRHLNPLKTEPERITKALKRWLMILIMKVLNLSKKDFGKIEKKNNICINVFCYENRLAYPVYLSDQEFEIVWIHYWLMMKISHIMSTSKTLTDLCAIKQSVKINTFVDIVDNVLVVIEFWQCIKKFVWK